MKAASLAELKKELVLQDNKKLVEICLRLARYKKESKELLTYLLLEADDERTYIASIKGLIDEEFLSLPTEKNAYFIKKSLRKILRMVNRYVRYSGRPETELEVRLHYCAAVKRAGVPLVGGTVLDNLYRQQVKKIQQLLKGIPEDLVADYSRELEEIG